MTITYTFILGIMLFGWGITGAYIGKFNWRRGASLMLAGLSLACLLNPSLHLLTTVLMIAAVVLMAHEARRDNREGLRKA
jgi:Na+-transporting NADH:ubiquinone oxidoreductase subunit NqrB